MEIAGNCSPLEWAQATAVRMFEIQPTRTILKINNVALTIPITRKKSIIFVRTN